MFKLSDVEIAADLRWQDYVHPEISSSYKCVASSDKSIVQIVIYKNVQSFLDDIKNCELDSSIFDQRVSSI